MNGQVKNIQFYDTELKKIISNSINSSLCYELIKFAQGKGYDVNTCKTVSDTLHDILLWLDEAHKEIVKVSMNEYALLGSIKEFYGCEKMRFKKKTMQNKTGEYLLIKFDDGYYATLPIKSGGFHGLVNGEEYDFSQICNKLGKELFGND